MNYQEQYEELYQELEQIHYRRLVKDEIYGVMKAIELARSLRQRELVKELGRFLRNLTAAFSVGGRVTQEGYNQIEPTLLFYLRWISLKILAFELRNEGYKVVSENKNDEKIHLKDGDCHLVIDTSGWFCYVDTQDGLTGDWDLDSPYESSLSIQKEINQYILG